MGKAKAGHGAGLVDFQDLPWLRRLFDVPGADQAYVISGLADLSPAGKPGDVFTLRTESPGGNVGGLSSIHRDVIILPVDLWTAENSTVVFRLNGTPMMPAKQQVSFTGIGVVYDFPRRYSIPPGKAIEIRFQNNSALGQAAWFFWIPGAICVETLD